MNPTQTVGKGLSELAPGAADWIIPRCPSLTDVDRGGCIDVDLLLVKTLNQTMLKEITEAFMGWPFRPTKSEMMVRLGSQAIGFDLDV